MTSRTPSWTGIIARIMYLRETIRPEQGLGVGKKAAFGRQTEAGIAAPSVG
jgi:hypothetical protein